MDFSEPSLDSRLNVKFSNLNGNLIYESDKDFRTLLNVDESNADYKVNGATVVKIDIEEEISVIPGTQYRIDFEIESDKLEDQIALYRDYNEVVWDDSTYLFDYSNDYALLNGERKNYILCMQIIGIGNK